MTAPTNPPSQRQVPPSAATTAATYLAASTALRSRLLGFVAAQYGAYGDYRDAAAAAFVAAVVPAALAAQQAMASLTSAYLSHVIAAQAGGTYRPPPVPLDEVTGDALRGVPMDEVYRRPFTSVWIDLSKGKGIEDAARAGAQRAEVIAATDLELARTRMAQRVISADSRVTGYRRVLNGAHSCALCVLASTVRYHKEELMPLHPRCVPAGSRVRAHNVLNATRRWHEGKLVILTTSSGDQVTVTSKHPVLTDHGWISAHAIRQGDYLVRGDDGIEREIWSRPDKCKAPPLIEDVWRALAVTFGFSCVPLATEDFHGDGSDGDVDVVHADGYFSTIGDTTASQIVNDFSLVPRWRRWRQFTGLSMSTSLKPAKLSSTSDAIGSERLSGTLLGGHLCAAHETGVRTAATRDVALLEPTSDGRATNTLLMRDRDFGESPIDIVDPKLLSRVVDVTHVDSSCHVYNLQTMTGTFEANSHIIHNCDCSIAPLFDNERPDMMPAEMVHKVIERDLGPKYVQAGGRGPIHYRDIVVTHHHSEIGPVLGVRRRPDTQLPEGATAYRSASSLAH